MLATPGAVAPKPDEHSMVQDLVAEGHATVEKVPTVSKKLVENLKTTDINQILTSKVVAGKIVSVASKLGGTILGRSSANNLPPSLRGTAVGRITQVATAFKSQASRAVSAIGSFFKGFRF